MIPVPLFDLKFLTELAAIAVGTSNRRHCSDRFTEAGNRSSIMISIAARLVVINQPP
jgi:hypothetical protein